MKEVPKTRYDHVHRYMFAKKTSAHTSPHTAGSHVRQVPASAESTFSETSSWSEQSSGAFPRLQDVDHSFSPLDEPPLSSSSFDKDIPYLADVPVEPPPPRVLFAQAAAEPLLSPRGAAEIAMLSASNRSPLTPHNKPVSLLPASILAASPSAPPLPTTLPRGGGLPSPRQARAAGSSQPATSPRGERAPPEAAAAQPRQLGGPAGLVWLRSHRELSPSSLSLIKPPSCAQRRLFGCMFGEWAMARCF